MLTLDKMRSWQKIIIWATIIPMGLAFGVVGSCLSFGENLGKEKPVGKIFDKNISYTEYHMFGNQFAVLFRYFSFLEQFRIQSDFTEKMELLGTGKNAGDKDDRVWDFMTFVKIAEKEGINCSDDEVVMEIKKNYLIKNPEGNLNVNAYGNLLRAYIGSSRRDFENALRNYIKVRKLCDIALGVSVGDKKIAFEKLLPDELKHDIQYVKIPAQKFFDKVEFSELNLKKFYQELSNRRNYEKPERIRLNYAVFPASAYFDQAIVSPEEVKTYYEEYKDKLYVIEPEHEVDGNKVPATYRPFEDVQAGILDAIKFERALPLAKAQAEEASRILNRTLKLKIEQVRKEEAEKTETPEKPDNPDRNPDEPREPGTTPGEKPVKPKIDPNEPIGPPSPDDLKAEKLKKELDQQNLKIKEGLIVIENNKYGVDFATELREKFGSGVEMGQTPWFEKNERESELLRQMEDLNLFVEGLVDAKNGNPISSALETEISGPHRNSRGFFVFQIHSTAKKGAMPFEEVENQVRNDYLMSEALKLARKEAEDIRKEVEDKIKELSKDKTQTEELKAKCKGILADTLGKYSTTAFPLTVVPALGLKKEEAPFELSHDMKLAGIFPIPHNQKAPENFVLGLFPNSNNPDTKEIFVVQLIETRVPRYPEIPQSKISSEMTQQERLEVNKKLAEEILKSLKDGAKAVLTREGEKVEPNDAPEED